MEGTIITLSIEKTNKNIINELAKLKEKIIKSITDEEREGLKILTSTEYSTNKISANHVNIFVNKRVDLDISKNWTHGQSSVNHYEQTDQCKEAIKYITHCYFT